MMNVFDKDGIMNRIDHAIGLKQKHKTCQTLSLIGRPIDGKFNLLKTSKGIAKVVDFLQNECFLFTNTRLFSLQDELYRNPCARFGRENQYEVVFGQCDRSLTIPKQNFSWLHRLGRVLFLTLHIPGELLCRKKERRKPPRRPQRKP